LLFCPIEISVATIFKDVVENTFDCILVLLPVDILSPKNFDEDGTKDEVLPNVKAVTTIP
jgi:hypothetical protein